MTISKGAFPSGGRGDRRVIDSRQDPYLNRKKLHEPTVCPSCGAVYHEGSWRWMDRPVKAEEALCPACRRVQDNCEAGTVILNGDYLKTHKDEIVRLAKNEEKKEKKEHPLHRIMKLEETQEGITILTTDIHLPRRIGEAVRHACQGALDMHYDEDGYYVRVNWSR